MSTGRQARDDKAKWSQRFFGPGAVDKSPNKGDTVNGLHGGVEDEDDSGFCLGDLDRGSLSGSWLRHTMSEQ